MDVSIVVCTRNRAHSLGATLASLNRISSACDWEVLLVDNASTDDTASVIQASDDCGGRLRYAYAADIGLGAARDTAWRLTEGAVICFSDDDCYFRPDYVDKIRTAFADYPEAGVIGGRILLHDPLDAPITIDERTEPVAHSPYTYIAAGALHGANLSFRRDALDKAGGFDRNLGAGTPFPCEDIDAVASVLWAGYSGRYDPRPTVEHHHGRRQGDLPGLKAGYDRGRGAYFIKYIDRADTRRAYIQAWRQWLRATGGAEGWMSRLREGLSAIRWLGRRRRYVSIVVVAAAMTVFVSEALLRRFIERLLGPRPSRT